VKDCWDAVDFVRNSAERQALRWETSPELTSSLLRGLTRFLLRTAIACQWMRYAPCAENGVFGGFASLRAERSGSASVPVFSQRSFGGQDAIPMLGRKPFHSRRLRSSRRKQVRCAG
jgi:hypothetical protein